MVVVGEGDQMVVAVAAAEEEEEEQGEVGVE